MTQSTIKFSIIYSKNLRDEGFVMLSNNVECKVVGICMVKVNILNQITKTLDNMRDVTEIEKKSDFFRLLDFFVYGYSARGGYERITKGSLQVIKREKSFRNLYRLNGETIKVKESNGKAKGRENP